MKANFGFLLFGCMLHSSEVRDKQLQKALVAARRFVEQQRKERIKLCRLYTPNLPEFVGIKEETVKLQQDRDKM